MRDRSSDAQSESSKCPDKVMDKAQESSEKSGILSSKAPYDEGLLRWVGFNRAEIGGPHGSFKSMGWKER